MLIERWLEHCESTQTELKREAAAGATPGSFVFSERQTKGRGRGDHTWTSEKGNLHLSYLERKPSKLPLTWIPILSGIAAARVLHRLNRAIELKWPNDLWFDDAKCGGILCESISSEYVVIGIGINCHHIPPELVEKEQSSALAISSHELVKPLIKEISLLLAQAEKLDASALASSFFAFSLLQPGDQISFSEKNEPSRGMVIGLGDHGELLVTTPTGERALFSEEVQLVRPA